MILISEGEIFLRVDIILSKMEFYRLKRRDIGFMSGNAKHVFYKVKCNTKNDFSISIDNNVIYSMQIKCNILHY